jgi:hypothetical protein
MYAMRYQFPKRGEDIRREGCMWVDNTELHAAGRKCTNNVPPAPIGNTTMALDGHTAEIGEQGRVSCQRGK